MDIIWIFGSEKLLEIHSRVITQFTEVARCQHEVNDVFKLLALGKTSFFMFVIVETEEDGYVLT